MANAKVQKLQMLNEEPKTASFEYFAVFFSFCGVSAFVSNTHPRTVLRKFQQGLEFQELQSTPTGEWGKGNSSEGYNQRPLMPYLPGISCVYLSLLLLSLLLYIYIHIFIYMV